MQTVAASVILDDAYRLIGWDADQLDDRERADARMSLSLALQEVWEEWWWDELMTCQQRQFARTYASATTYAAGDFVYYPATDKYYQCLQAATGQAPETLSAGVYTVNASYWLEAEESYTGEDYESLTDAAELEAGDVVRYGVNGNYYAWLDATLSNDLTVTSTIGGGGTYTYSGTANGRAAYVNGARSELQSLVQESLSAEGDRMRPVIRRY